MSDSEKPERFITVGQSELIVNGRTYPLARTGGGEFELRQAAALPTGDAEFRFRLFSDDGELLSDSTKQVRILESSSDSRTTYRVETTVNELTNV